MESRLTLFRSLLVTLLLLYNQLVILNKIVTAIDPNHAIHTCISFNQLHYEIIYKIFRECMIDGTHNKALRNHCLFW